MSWTKKTIGSNLYFEKKEKRNSQNMLWCKMSWTKKNIGSNFYFEK